MNMFAWVLWPVSVNSISKVGELVLRSVVTFLNLNLFSSRRPERTSTNFLDFIIIIIFFLLLVATVRLNAYLSLILHVDVFGLPIADLTVESLHLQIGHGGLVDVARFGLQRLHEVVCHFYRVDVLLRALSLFVGRVICRFALAEVVLITLDSLLFAGDLLRKGIQVLSGPVLFAQHATLILLRLQAEVQRLLALLFFQLFSLLGALVAQQRILLVKHRVLVSSDLASLRKHVCSDKLLVSKL
jgi:hypothetical protein